MNNSARKHLDKAADYVVKSEEFYDKAADEINAAMDADPMLTQREVGEYIGEKVRGEAYSRKWVGDIVAWDTAGRTSATPHTRTDNHQDKVATRKILRELPAKEIAEFLAEPKVRLKVKQAMEQAEPSWTPPKHESKSPSFIEYINRIREAQHGLDQLMKGWTGPEAIPAAFSPATFIDIAETAMEQKERVEDLRDADHDEFRKIIKNFKAVPSVR